MSAVSWATPGADLVLPVDPDMTEWLTLRRAGLGGTDAATIMGANKFSNLFSTWMDKTSVLPPENLSSDLLWFGHEVEPMMRRRFTTETRIATRRVGTLRSKTHPFMQANIDGLTSDGGILEIKSTDWFTDAGKEWTGGDIPDHPWWQVQHCLAVSGRSHGWFVALVGRKFIIAGPIERDEEAIERLIAAERAFWEGYVVAGVAPPIDFSTIDEDEARARFPVGTPDATVAIDDQPVPEIWIDTLDDFLAARTAESDAKTKKEAAKARLMGFIGDKQLLTLGGQPVLKWGKTAGASYLDGDDIVQRLAELEGKTEFEVRREHTKKRADTRSLTVVKQKMEKAA